MLMNFSEMVRSGDMSMNQTEAIKEKMSQSLMGPRQNIKIKGEVVTDVNDSIKNARNRENLIDAETKDPQKVEVSPSKFVPEIEEAADILTGKKEGPLPGPESKSQPKEEEFIPVE